MEWLEPVLDTAKSIATWYIIFKYYETTLVVATLTGLAVCGVKVLRKLDSC